MSAHCDYCACPWRSVLLRLAAFPLASHLIARQYGLHKSTVVKVVRDARAKGCLPERQCWVCKEGISTRRTICTKRECYLKDELVRSRRRRGHYGRSEGRSLKLGHHRRAPPGFEWPALPPNPRLDTPLRPPQSEAPPVLHPEWLTGVGNRTATVRAKARLSAGFLVPASEVAVMPWRSHVAPPLCPTIGSLVHGRMAA